MSGDNPFGRLRVFARLRGVEVLREICADNLVRFSVEGPADIAAVGNGDQTSLDPFTVDWRKAFNGKCVVYLRSTPGASGGYGVT